MAGRRYDLELSCCEVGHSLESLLYFIHHRWRTAKENNKFPFWIESHLSLSLSGLDTIAENGAGRVGDVAKKLRSSIESAFSKFKADWLGDEHRQALRYWELSDPEYVPLDAFGAQAPLHLPPWIDVFSSQGRLEEKLPREQSACLTMGGLVHRVSRLLGDVIADDIPGERYPVKALQKVVSELREMYPVLADIDASLLSDGSPSAYDLKKVKAEADRFYENALKRFSEQSVPPAESANSVRAGQPARTADLMGPQTYDSNEYKRLLKIRREIDPEESYIGKSYAILKMFERVWELNRLSDKPVLILGPTGAGKTELAELIHRHSCRTGELCREQATDAMQSDKGITRSRWVGYGPASEVSGADPKGKRGILQEYNKGTIFFDELHACPEEFQTFLLRVLDKQQIPTAHGKHQTFTPDVRLIFASYLSLDALKVKVNPDLMRRLNQWVLEVPQLADRKEDILEFVEKTCDKRKPDADFLLALLNCDWPGNVGQLLDVLQQAMTKSGGDTRLRLEHLTLPDQSLSVIEELRSRDTGDVERDLFQELEKILQRQGYQKGKGLHKRMADILGVSPATISRNAVKYLSDLG